MSSTVLVDLIGGVGPLEWPSSTTSGRCIRWPERGSQWACGARSLASPLTGLLPQIWSRAYERDCLFRSGTVRLRRAASAASRRSMYSLIDLTVIRRDLPSV